MAGINLEGLETTDEGVRCVLRHPGTREALTDDEGNEAALIMVGEDSPQVRAIDLKHSRRWRGDLDRMGKVITPTPEQAEAQAIERLAAATIGVEYLNNGADPWTPESIRKMYGNRKLAWIREQAAEFFKDRANFLSGSKPS